MGRCELNSHMFREPEPSPGIKRKIKACAWVERLRRRLSVGVWRMRDGDGIWHHMLAEQAANIPWHTNEFIEIAW